MSRQKVISFTIKGHVPFDAKKIGSATEAEKKILAAKEAAEKAGVTVVDFSAHHTSVEQRSCAAIGPTSTAAASSGTGYVA